MIGKKDKPIGSYSKKDQKVYLRDKAYRILNLSGIHSYSSNSTKKDLLSSRKGINIYCRELYYDSSTASNYDYLYSNVNKKIKKSNGGSDKVTLTLPARVRHIPIVEEKIKSLISKAESREIKFRAYTIDKKGLARKHKSHVDKHLKSFNDKLFQRQVAIMQVQQMKSMLQQMMGEYQQVEGGENIIMQLQSEIMVIDQELMKELMLTKEEQSVINDFFKYSFKDSFEMMTESALHEFIDRKQLLKMKNRQFEEQMITDEPIYYVNYDYGTGEPTVREVKPENLEYQSSDLANYIDEVDWAIERLPYTKMQAIEEFGRYLTKKDYNDLISNKVLSQEGYNYANLQITPDGKSFDSVNHKYNTKKFNADWNSEIECFRIFFKEDISVNALYTTNDNPSVYFKEKPDHIAYITDKEAEDYNTGVKKLKKNQRVETRYRTDLYEAIAIGREFVKVIGKRTDAPRSESNVSKVPLPYIGYNISPYNRPNSIMWKTKDLQEIYNILQFQRELIVNLSGVKGIIYNMSQKPEGMSLREVIYYMKQGIMPIETVNKAGKKKDRSFNQYATYDQTVSPSLQYIDAAMQSILSLVSQITGIYPQLSGEIKRTDQVGTYQMGLDQANMAIQHYFSRADNLFERVLTRLSNYFPLAYKEGKIGHYVMGGEGQKLLKIPANKLKGEFKIRIRNGLKEERASNMIKMIAQQKHTQGQVSTAQLITIMNLDSVKEMERRMIEFEDQAQKIAQANQQQLQEQDSQMKAQLQQMAAQTQAQLEQLKGQMKMQSDQLKAQTEQMKMQMQSQIKQEEINANKEIAEGKNQTDIYEANLEAEVEKSYIQQQYDQMQMQERQHQRSAMLDNIDRQIKFSQSRRKAKIKD